jgi:threonine synthase
MAHQWRGLIEEYRDRLPVSSTTPVVTLREGGTPLVYACNLSEMTGCEVWLKFEGANPTGSFKDRGMTMAISKAAEEGAKAVICASTGNTSASAAAYAVKAGMVCAVLVPQGKIAMGKLAQAIVHGAVLLQVDGNFDDCLLVARKLSDTYPVALVNSVNPVRIEGQKTASFEIVDMLGRAPDIHCLPVGNAGNITAYWRGYLEYQRDGLAASALQSFVDGILGRMVFDGEQLSDLMAPLDLGWKARSQAELALMADLYPLLAKRASGRDISGLSAYEQ